MIKEIDKVTVKYQDRVVGYLVRNKDQRISFQYDDEWIQNGFSISPLSLKLSNQIYINTKDPYSLFGVFNDSLPDGWGELLVARYLARQGIDYDKLSPLTKLTLISNNGLGGLKYEPTQGVSLPNDKNYDFDKMAQAIKELLNDDYQKKTLDEIYQLGGSSGGARPKAHIKIKQEDWIVKFPSHIDSKNIGQEEYHANLLAKECGINVPEIKLFPSKKCHGYFGVKRFDRQSNKPIHMISLAAILETSHRLANLDYIHLFQVISIIGKTNDLYEAFRRMCFNVYYMNKDDHSKNFSFIYDEKMNHYYLSPAYDLTKTKDKLEHEMTVNGSPNPSDDDILAVARRFKLDIKVCQEIMHTIKEVVQYD
ncbi:MAG: type II toxin-antitoxin system HipA family toxin [Bacilli bacterium]|nr:type II toxin-antitoxin system HipA family toxin [Bacilli bacterium]